MNAPPLSVSAAAMRDIDDVVQAAGVRECLGFLASTPGDEAVTAIEHVPSRATALHASAPPMAIKSAIDRLSSRGLIVRGIWHSHGHMPVFHSATDVKTIHRLLPAMAARTRRAEVQTKGPALEGRDRVVLPLDDGRHLALTLAADVVPDTDMAEPVTWSSIDLSPAAGGGPIVEIGSSAIRLIAGDVSLRLGIPEGAYVISRLVERSSASLARLYSLVVNTRRQHFAQCLAVADIDGARFTSLDNCDVVIGKDLDGHGSI